MAGWKADSTMGELTLGEGGGDAQAAPARVTTWGQRQGPGALWPQRTGSSSAEGTRKSFTEGRLYKDRWKQSSIT